MNVHSSRPDRSPEAVEKRRRAIEQATAANKRQGYVLDPVLENANARYVAGDITIEEHRAEMMARFQKS
ncbi:FixJ family two-component response regulator [Labrenzia sp. MBR-25]